MAESGGTLQTDGRGTLIYRCQPMCDWKKINKNRQSPYYTWFSYALSRMAQLYVAIAIWLRGILAILDLPVPLLHSNFAHSHKTEHTEYLSSLQCSVRCYVIIDLLWFSWRVTAVSQAVDQAMTTMSPPSSSRMTCWLFFRRRMNSRKNWRAFERSWGWQDCKLIIIKRC